MQLAGRKIRSLHAGVPAYQHTSIAWFARLRLQKKHCALGVAHVVRAENSERVPWKLEGGTCTVDSGCLDLDYESITNITQLRRYDPRPTSTSSSNVVNPRLPEAEVPKLCRSFQNFQARSDQDRPRHSVAANRGGRSSCMPENGMPYQDARSWSEMPARKRHVHAKA